MNANRHNRVRSPLQPGWVGLFLAFVSIFASAEPQDDHRLLFNSGKEGYPRYRIPSLVVAKNGDLLAICEGRASGGGLTGNVDVILKRSTDDGKTWGPIRVITDQGTDTAGNQGVVVDRETGTIWVAFTISPGERLEKDITEGDPGNATRVFITHSEDHGETWSAPRDLSPDCRLPNWTWYGCGPGTGIQLKTGRLLIPCYRAENPPDVTRRSHVIFSDDHGKTWKLSGDAGEGNGECQIAEKRDGGVYLTARTSGDGPEKRSIVTSQDGGLTWSEKLYDEQLYDSHCEASVLVVPNEDSEDPLWLYCHPAGPDRIDLTVRISRDEGDSWKFHRLLRKGNSQYSSMAVLPDGSIGCLYDCWENGNYQLYFTRFDRPS